MQVWEGVLVVLAGAAAGAVNAVVGSGTLITFPTLVALGVPPVTANVSNNVGLVPGSLAAAWGYRRELSGQHRRLLLLVPGSAVGGAVGAALLLRLPSVVFDTVVPVLVLLAVLLVAVQPRLSAAVVRREQARGGAAGAGAAVVGGPVAVTGVLITGVYGGYFGAAQGVLLIALLGVLLRDSLHRVNGLKNLLAAVVNGCAALVFVLAAPYRVDWLLVALVAAGSTAGGMIGAAGGRRLPTRVLRAVVIGVGVLAVVVLVLR